MRKWLGGILIVLVMSGCAAHRPVMGYSPAGSTQEEQIDLLLEPYETVGVSETEAIRNPENGTFLRCVIPDILFGGEFSPGRIRWNAWASDSEGRESFGQVIISSVEQGRFYGLAIFDQALTSEARVVILSTNLDFAYDFLGDNEVPLDGKKFREDQLFRWEFIRENGTIIESLARVDGSSAVARIKKWNGYQTPEGMLWSVLGWKEIERIAAINSQYSWTEKLAGSMHGSLMMNPTGIIIGAAFDLLGSVTAPEKGWDFGSQLPSRRSMAMVIDYVSKLKQRSIDEYFERQAQVSFSERRQP